MEKETETETETKTKTTQSPPSTCTTTTAYPPTITTSDDDDQPETKNPAAKQETKRSKHCPAALWLGNSGFHFSFDPRYCNGVSTPEVTPKFGSFSLVTAADDAENKSEKIADRKTKDEDEEQEEDEDDGKRFIHHKRKIDDFMGEIEGFTSAD